MDIGEQSSHIRWRGRKKPGEIQMGKYDLNAVGPFLACLGVLTATTLPFVAPYVAAVILIVK